MWIRPVFTIIPLNSLLIPQIGKFDIIFDTRPCEIDDLAVSSRQIASRYDGELFRNMNTRVLSEHILLLLLIHQFEKLSIH